MSVHIEESHNLADASQKAKAESNKVELSAKPK